MALRVNTNTVGWKAQDDCRYDFQLNSRQDSRTTRTASLVQSVGNVHLEVQGSETLSGYHSAKYQVMGCEHMLLIIGIIMCVT